MLTPAPIIGLIEQKLRRPLRHTGFRKPQLLEPAAVRQFEMGLVGQLPLSWHTHCQFSTQCKERAWRWTSFSLLMVAGSAVSTNSHYRGRAGIMDEGILAPTAQQIADLRCRYRSFFRHRRQDALFMAADEMLLESYEALFQVDDRAGA